MRYDKILAEILAPWMIERIAGERLFDLISRRASGEMATPSELSKAAEIRSARDRRKAKEKPRGVSVIPLYGPMVKRADLFSEVSGLASTDQIAAWVDEAAADPGVEAIVLDVDSPGGSVHGTEELASRIAAAAGKKKVIAVANATAASAAYYVASQASELVVTPSGWVGSIGVVWTYTDDSEREKAEGVNRVVIATSERKAQNGGGPLTPAGRAEMEEIVAGYFDQFVRAVARGRNVTQKRVREEFGDGGMLLAERAVKIGMADKVGTLDEVLGRYGLSTSDLIRAEGPIAAPSATAGTRDRDQRAAKPIDFDVEIRKRMLILAEIDLRSRLANEKVAAMIAESLRARRSMLTAAQMAGVAEGPPADGRSAAEDRNVCLHEAGHCVATLALGGRVKWATANPSPGTTDGWKISGSMLDDGLDDVSRLVVLVAGGEADGAAGLSGKDLADANLLDPDHTRRGAARVQARQILARNRAAVERLANALASYRSLTGAEVEQIAGPIH